MKRRISFTLIELLTVIAVIAMLAAMLLPSLRRARESARKIHCASNQKQIATCWFSYIDDNQGILPPATWDNIWAWKLYSYSKSNILYPSGVVYPTVPASSIFACPANSCYCTTGSTTQYSYPVNYAMNIACGIKWSSGTGIQSQKIGNIPKASNSYILMDGASIENNGKGAKSVRVWIQKEYPEYSGFIHGAAHPAGITNILYADGHVDKARFSEIILDKYDVYRTKITF